MGWVGINSGSGLSSQVDCVLAALTQLFAPLASLLPRAFPSCIFTTPAMMSNRGQAVTTRGAAVATRGGQAVTTRGAAVATRGAGVTTRGVAGP